MAQTGSKSRLLRVFVITLILWSWNTVSASKPKLFSPGIKYPIELKQVTSEKNVTLVEMKLYSRDIAIALKKTMQDIKRTCMLDKKKHFVLMSLRQEAPLQFELAPMNLYYEFSRYFYDNNDVLGFLIVKGIIVIIVGKGFSQYLYAGKNRKTFHLIEFPPSNVCDGPYWRITDNDSTIVVGRHLTKTPHIFF